MDTMAESKMPARVTREVDCIRIDEVAGVAVGRPEYHVDEVAAWDGDAADLSIFYCIALGCGLDRTAVSQQLLDPGPDEVRLSVKPFELLGVLE
jgi:hypothetical protein